MQPRTGTWSFDDHTTSAWVPADLGIPTPTSGASTSSEPVRDESAIWDDPEEATRKLSSQDLARTLDSATDLEMDWDEDESATNTYNPAHARAFMQAAVPHAAARPTAKARPQSVVRQRAVRPEDLVDLTEDAELPRRADPATAGALASIQPRVTQREVRPRRPTPSANITSTRPKAQPVQRTAPTAAPIASGKRALRINPEIAGRVQLHEPAPIQARTVLPVMRAAPQPTRATLPPTLRPRTIAGPALIPQAAPPRREQQTIPQLQAARSLPPVVRQPRTATLPPEGLNIAPPPPQAAATGNERAWTHAWEEAQALARASLHSPDPAAPEYPSPRRLQTLRGDGPTLRNFPPAEPAEAHAQYAPAYESAQVLPLAAARHELLAAQTPVAPLSLEWEDVDVSQALIKQEVKRLALWSAIPGIALFGAVLIGRVLLTGPSPAPAPAAPVTQVAPVQTAPAQLDAPTLSPLPSSAVPAAATSDRRSNSHASRSRTRARDDGDSSDTPASSTSASRTSRSGEDDDSTPSTESRSRTREASPAPAASTSEEAAPAPVERESAIGILRLNSRPWSQVFIDGKLVGNTPQMGLRLRAGTHQVELVNPQLVMHKKFPIEIQADEITTRAETLEE